MLHSAIIASAGLDFFFGLPIEFFAATGRYQMVSESGEKFEIFVPTFSLDGPDNKRVLN